MAREHKASYPDARQFASYLLSVLGKRADAQENAVTLKEAESLEDAEIEEFAAGFLESNQWAIMLSLTNGAGCVIFCSWARATTKNTNRSSLNN